MLQKTEDLLFLDENLSKLNGKGTRIIRIILFEFFPVVPWALLCGPW